VITYIPTYSTAHEHCLSTLASYLPISVPYHTIPYQPTNKPIPPSNNNVLLNPHPIISQQQQQQTAHPPPQQLHVWFRLLLQLRRNARLKLRFLLSGLFAFAFRERRQGQGQREGSGGGCAAEEGELVGYVAYISLWLGLVA
jgi:hypothetical protein